MKISENTSVSMPVKNMLMIIAGVVAGVFAYTEITARLTSLETSRELFQADLLKKSEQLPTDQEQYMLLEALFSDVEKLQKNQEQNILQLYIPYKLKMDNVLEFFAIIEADFLSISENNAIPYNKILQCNNQV